MNELATPRGTLRIRATDGAYIARVHGDDGYPEDLILGGKAIVERVARANHPAVSGLQIVRCDETMLDVIHPSRGPSTQVSALETIGAILRPVADIGDGLAAIASLDGDPIACGPFSPRLFVRDPIGGRLLCPGLWGAAYDFDKRLKGTLVVPFIESRESVLGIPRSEQTETFYLAHALFVLLAARDPFGPSGLEYLRAVCESSGTELASLRPDFPVALSDLVTAALSPDPSARPTLAELAGHLRTIADTL